MSERNGRPAPEALLAAAQQEGRGRLKIFLGAAPGVGKTYEMLLSAQARRREGVDVAVGIVEPHGRSETEALLDGLEIIPRQEVEYRGHRLAEMDLDAILKRRPQLVLVDELAHANAPGARHPKRHLDAEELIAAGIDVFATLNIQHVESLNDVVARITRIRVRETVPDSVLDQADDIEIVDLSPQDLIKRLHEGKVYVAPQAERATRHFFSPGNLTALRELALRRTAQRVDEQLLSHMREHAITGPWPASERMLVCVGASAGAAGLIRHARRAADRLRVPWTAIHVETPHAPRRGDAERDRVADHLRLAERLGATTLTLPGRSVADEILTYARANNITEIVVGKPARSGWTELVRASVFGELMRKSGQISLHVIAAEPETPAPGRSVPSAAAAEPIHLGPYLGSAASVAIALGVGMLLGRVVAVQSIALVFLTAVLAAAVAWGLLPSLFACVLSVLVYNFFFLPPLYTFSIGDPENVVALFFFLIVAVIVSHLTAATRRQAMSARARAKTTAELYAFSRKIVGIGALDDLLWATVHQIAAMLKLRTVLLMPADDGEGIEVASGYPPEDRLDAADMAAARWSWEHNRPAGRDADTLPGCKRLFLPLRTRSGPVGVLGVDRERPGPLLTPEERRLLDALTDQAAVAIERIVLARGLDEARMLAETERLRGALLTSLSHDLRTPLAAILGAVSSLRSYPEQYGASEREVLLGTLQDEAERLNRFVANLLDMTRLEAGAVVPKIEPVDVADMIGAALRRAASVLAGRDVELAMEPDLPALRLDPVLFEQVLFNLLDNAAKYAPDGSRIEISGRRDGAMVEITISDEGPGIPAGDLERVFDKFYRVEAQDRRRAGTGLGLAICRGFVEALGGRISAGNRRDRSGAMLTIVFPIASREAISARPVAAPDRREEREGAHG
ncbi:MAG: DUF4118 domain-containing protein [Stellaceae bacterium]